MNTSHRHIITVIIVIIIGIIIKGLLLSLFHCSIIIAQVLWRLRYRLEDRGLGIRFPVEIREFYPLRDVYTGFEAHPASHKTGTGAALPVVKRQGREGATDFHLLPHTSSCRGP